MKLSIVTINYNNAAGLRRTINSVLKQSFTDYEYIIIDGGSNDDSLTVIQEYKSRLSYWVSEADRGVFHAMNKGINKSRGDYLLMLNSGDVLYNSDVLEKVSKDSHNNEDLIYGDVLRESNGKVFVESKFPNQLTFLFLHDGAISHQAVFIKRMLHDKVGLYDENLRYSSDWSFILLAICKYNASYKHLPYRVAICNCNGFTCDPTNFHQIGRERGKVLNEHFSAFIEDYQNFIKSQKNKLRSKFSVWIAEAIVKLKFRWRKIANI